MNARPGKSKSSTILGKYGDEIKLWGQCMVSLHITKHNFTWHQAHRTLKINIDYIVSLQNNNYVGMMFNKITTVFLNKKKIRNDNWTWMLISNINKNVEVFHTSFGWEKWIYLIFIHEALNRTAAAKGSGL